MNEKEKSGLESIKGERDVQRALKQAKGKKKGFKIKASTKDKISLSTYMLILLGLAVLKYILEIGTFLHLDFVNNFLPQQLQLSEKLIQGAMTVVLLITLSKLIKVLFINGIEDPSTKFNLHRIINLLAGIILFFIIISILFANWYTAVVSLGLISLILGFALQAPLTSFISWIHIIITKPFKVGDRIKMGEATGDVIDIGYLETTLWESVGENLSTDYPSGRIIRFPNSSILSTPVYNYSWPLFPYIWEEVKFFVALSSDIEFVSTTMRKMAEEEMESEFAEKILIYQEILKETAVDEKQVAGKPVISLRINDNAWMEASVRYLVEPKLAGELKSKLVVRILSEFKKHPDKVLITLGAER
jgi:small-conductance mechanosensitive channel